MNQQGFAVHHLPLRINKASGTAKVADGCR